MIVTHLGASERIAIVLDGGEPALAAGRNRFGSVRFGSGFLSKVHRFGSVRFGSEDSFSRFDAVRPALFGRVVARSGSVRFRVRFRPFPELNGLVRFGSASSVRFLITSSRSSCPELARFLPRAKQCSVLGYRFFGEPHAIELSYQLSYPSSFL